MPMPLRRDTFRFTTVVALGFFALVAQTLLFRGFFTVFEGNELGIGAFFASWFVWIAAGALAARPDSPVHRGLAARFEAVALLYIPAFVLQHTLIARARVLAGVEAFELFPFAGMFAMAFLVNAPVSFVTGFLFTMACRWAERCLATPVSRVYICETLGGCAGGLFVTLLLARGVAAESVFLAAAGVLAAAVIASFLSQLEGRAVWGAAAVPVLLAILLGAALYHGLGAQWAHANARRAWARLLPAETYEGHFTTPQARYLYGEREGQFMVVSGGGVCETLPPGDPAAEIVALHLAQKPDARNVLVFGEHALGVCMKLKALPQIAHVTWLHPDPEYPRVLLDVLGRRGTPADAPDDIPATDIRAFAHATERRYDLVILNLPDVTTLLLNRYCTEEFFRLLAGILTDQGVVSVRVSGGENYLGGELALLGSSMLHTLSTVFDNGTLKPGDDTWFIATNGSGLAYAPSLLRDRFAGIEGADEVYPPDGVRALYPPDRIRLQMDLYQKTIAETDEALLRNTDRAPRALSYSLSLAVKQAGQRSLAALLPLLLRAGGWVFLCPVVLYGALRLVYLLKSGRRGPGANVFDAQFLVFSMGFASISFSIVLMFVYQARFGSLFLDIGLLTALFMLGSFVGSLLGERLAARRPRTVLVACVAVHLALLLVVAPLPEAIPKGLWVALFAACGLFTGAYFPMAAHTLRAAGRPARASGAALETLDHLGGASGALLTGLVLLPVFGGVTTMGGLAALVALNATPALLGRHTAARGDWFDRLARPVGYALFGVAACVLVLSHLVAQARAPELGDPLRDAAGIMLGTDDPQRKEVQLEDGRAFAYFQAPNDEEGGGGYVFPTDPWAADIYGYNGPISLAVHADPSGKLRDYQVLRSYETPVYLYMVEFRKERLVEANVFEPQPFQHVDVVSGATMTDLAILRILETAGRGFAEEVLKKTPAAVKPEVRGRWFALRSTEFRDFLCLAVLVSVAVALRFRPGAWRRRLVLAATLVTTGVVLNLQYSTHQVVSLAGLNVVGVGLTGPFFLLVVVPVVVVLFGNVYCGYVCPFGALQELAGEFVPAPWRRLDARFWRYARALKYLILFVLVVLSAVARHVDVTQADPLVTVFSTAREGPVVVLVAACIGLSLVFPRFWCRNLCPAGAFLSLFNELRFWRFTVARRRLGRCDLGVRTATDLDCLYCDRCNFAGERPGHRPRVGAERLRHAVFAIAVVAVAAAFLALTVSNGDTETPAAAQVSSQRVLPETAGESRDVDLERIKSLIRQRHLSDHEAQYYIPVPE